MDFLFVIYKHFDDYKEDHWSKPLYVFLVREDANKKLAALRSSRKQYPVCIDYSVEVKEIGELL